MQNNNFGQAQQRNEELINAQAFASKFQSKREIFRFLSSEAKIYLSPYETMTIWHLRDLASNKRKRIKADDMKHIEVPHFEGLSIENMLEYAAQFTEVMRALPIVRKEILKLPRSYVANLIYTIIGEPFA